MEKPNTDELKNRYSYHAPKNDQADRYEQVRAGCLALARKIVKLSPASLELEEALKAIDMAMFYANAAIARRE